MNNNPYIDYALQKGYTLSEIRTTKRPTRTFPYTVGCRTFHSEEEYQEALHEFMNGY